MTETALRPALGYMFLSVGSKSTLILTPEKITGFTKHRDAIYLTARQRGMKIKRLFLDHNTYRKASPFDQSEFVKAQIAAEHDELPLIVADFFQLARHYSHENAINRINALQDGKVEIIDAACGLPLKVINESVIQALLFQASRTHTARRLSAYKSKKSTMATSVKNRSATESAPRRQATTAARTLTADQFALTMSRLIQDARSELPPKQRENYTAIAKRLNDDGLYTRTGRLWIGQQVKRTLERTVVVKEKRKNARKKS